MFKPEGAGTPETSKKLTPLEFTAREIRMEIFGTEDEGILRTANPEKLVIYHEKMAEAAKLYTEYQKSPEDRMARYHDIANAMDRGENPKIEV